MRHGRDANGNLTTAYLSRVIMNPPAGFDVIFLNHDSLDCRKENLRVVDKAHSQRKKRVRKDSLSGIKGVRLDRKSASWVATLYRQGRAIRLGRFQSAAQAAVAFKQGVELWEYPEANYLPFPYK